MVIINCCCYTCRLSWSVAVVTSPWSSPASGPAVPFVPPLLFFLSSSCSRTFLSALLYSLRHFIYSLIFSSAPLLSAHRFLSSSILSFLSLARPFHACLSNVFCLGHQSQHFWGLREVLVCFLFYYPFSITVLLFHFYPLKRALFKYSYSEISMFLLFHPQKGIIPSSQLVNLRYSWLIVPL